MYILRPSVIKSAGEPHPDRNRQVGAYCLLVEERYGVRPPYGVVVLAGGKRVEVENTEELQAEVLKVAAKIREKPGTVATTCGTIVRQVNRFTVPVSKRAILASHLTSGGEKS
jgi:hypothetical protein